MFSKLNHTNRQLLYAIIWLLVFTLCAVVVSLLVKPTEGFGQMQLLGQIASLAWILGFIVIFFAWARVDVLEYGKPVKSALIFAGLWLFFNFIAHIAYLFYTRGFRNGSLASIKFACFLLGTSIVWFTFGRLLGSIL